MTRARYCGSQVYDRLGGGDYNLDLKDYDVLVDVRSVYPLCGSNDIVDTLFHGEDFSILEECSGTAGHE